MELDEEADPQSAGKATKQNSNRQEPALIVVHEPPKLDLDAYISNYEGRTRLERLKTIGVCSKTLGVEALRKGALEASTGQDAELFSDLRALYKAAAPAGQSANDLDSISATRIEAHVQRETERLVNDLKGYKNNLIKESIRLGNDDLGQHYYRAGQFVEAARAFTSMREYCTVPKHAAEMSLKMILTAVAQRAWLTVTSNVMKLQSLNLKPEDKAKIEPMLAPLNGLSHLENGHYKEAASDFLKADAAYGAVEAVAGVRPSTQILTPNDVATYGGLCALATLPRNELATRVLENTEFRGFLELESHLRRAIVSFCDSKYTQCLEILEGHRADYLLDLHLQRHVEPLFAMIRRKSVVAYCGPFSRVSVAAMGAAFGVNAARMEEELRDMIASGDLSGASLDLVDMVLVAGQADARRDAHARALATAAEHERALRLRLYRLNMLQHGFDVRAPAPKKDDAPAIGRYNPSRAARA